MFNARQTGKSSLRVRVSSLLEQEGVQCVSLDLSGHGGKEKGMTAGKWYSSLIRSLNRDLALMTGAQCRQWLAVRKNDPASDVLRSFFEEVLLVQTGDSAVVVFVDEIDHVLSLGFDTSDLFALIRFFYNQRADNPDYQRLNFALFGVTTPSQLIQGIQTTPFNIGQAIALAPLKLSESKALAKGLTGYVERPQQILTTIFDWTGGQPFLTQRLCHLVREYADREGMLMAKDGIARVNALVRQQVLASPMEQDQQDYLKTIQRRLLQESEMKPRILDWYRQLITAGELAIPPKDPAVTELRLSGAVLQVGQRLTPLNRICQTVFDMSWVQTELAKLRPYAETFDLWVAS
ncbi:MAG: AAA-like domain-containing protein, partial [Cyanobacteria bacterium J06576_12]